MKNKETLSTELLDNLDASEIIEELEENTESVLNGTELESESTDSTELAGDANLELRDEDVPVPESSDVSSGDLAALLNGALNEYFEQNTIQVVIDAGDGIHKSLDELTLTEVCLVIIVLILLGRSILHIIGGRAWNRS